MSKDLGHVCRRRDWRCPGWTGNAPQPHPSRRTAFLPELARIEDRSKPFRGAGPRRSRRALNAQYWSSTDRTHSKDRRLAGWATGLSGVHQTGLRRTGNHRGVSRHRRRRDSMASRSSSPPWLPARSVAPSASIQQAVTPSPPMRTGSGPDIPPGRADRSGWLDADVHWPGRHGSRPLAAHPVDRSDARIRGADRPPE